MKLQRFSKRNPTTREQRLWALVDRRGENECWPWLGAKSTLGYGRVSWDGRIQNAHRVTWSVHYGKKFPAGLAGCHSCDNPTCVNPAHIWPGTHRDNMKDMSAKGRHGNRAKTHCNNGHELPAPNARGERVCRTCMNTYNRAYYQRKKAAVE